MMRIWIVATLASACLVMAPTSAHAERRADIDRSIPQVLASQLDRAVDVNALLRAAESVTALGDAFDVDAELTIEFANISYEVAPGDTLGAIARRYGVSVADLRRWNNLRGDRLSVGQVLTIRGSRGSGAERTRQTYTVRSGDTGMAIARRHSVSVAELSRWNPSVNIDRLRIGQTLSVYVETAPRSSGGSTGEPSRGRLRGGVQLPEGTGYRIRNSSRAYGTPATVAAIRNGIARVQAHFIDVPDVIIHDLSLERGGRMEPHASHQNGLDADISYYRLGVTDFSDWRTVSPEELDVRLQWYLFRTWIDLGVVEYIFVDFDLQRPLYEYARARGAGEEELAEWFQYPNRGSRRGIIRHEGGHRDHLHVRFHPGE